MTLLRYPAPGLSIPSLPVTRFDDEFRAVVAEISKARDDVERLGAGAVGLAAPQVGVNLRIFVWYFEGDHVVVNPTITEHSGWQYGDEGCLSLLGPFNLTKRCFDPGLELQVKRWNEITVEGQDETGEPIVVTCDGLLARVFQHEIDHLDGKLITDRVSAPVRKRALREFTRLHPTDRETVPA